MGYQSSGSVKWRASLRTYGPSDEGTRLLEGSQELLTLLKTPIERNCDGANPRDSVG